jgi:Skp family chaperone for outer membrane proteins
MLQAKVLPRRADFQSRQHDIETEAQHLQDDTSLADEKRGELTQALDKKRKQLEREEADAEQQLEQEEADLVDKLSPLLVKVLEKYAFEHQYAMIIDISDPHNPVLWASETVNLTKTIINLYDEASAQAPAAAFPETPKSQNAVKPRPPASTIPKPEL